MPEPKRTLYRIEVGARLKLAREALGLNQGEMGKILGINGNAVSMIEDGQRGLDPEKAIRLKKARAISLDYLFFGDAAGLGKEVFKAILKAGAPTEDPAAPRSPKRKVA